MKKALVLSSLLLLGSYNANAAGIYVSGGFANSDPDFSMSTLSGSSSDTGVNGVYPGFNVLNGWPGGENSTPDGLWAKQWEAGLPEKWTYGTEDTKTYSFAVGWAIPKNPFRFELEYLKTSFKAKSALMQVFPGADGEWCDNNSCTGSNIPSNVYNFDLVYEANEVRDNDVTSTMINVLFEIPGLGNIDPYIGYGYGFSKIKSTQFGESGGSKDNETTKQLIVGVEYRVPESPLIVGLEYKKLKVDTAMEKDDANTSLDYKQDMVMFKLKYDFISDLF